MKILVISQYFYPEKFRVNSLCKELVDRGNEVTVLTGYPQYPYGKIYDGYAFNKPYDKNWEGVNIERINMKPRGKTPLGLLMNCYSFVKEGYKWVENCNVKYDAIYVFEVSPVTVGLPAVKYKEKFGTPIYFNVQDLWPENVIHVMGIKNKLVINYINKIVDCIYEASDKILCSSVGFIDIISQRGVSKDKLVYWPQFCDDVVINDLKKPEVYKEDKFNIVFTGNIGKAQGLQIFIEALSKCENDNIHFYIVGDGREKESLEKYTNESNAKDKVTFMGKVSEHEANEYVHFANAAYLSLIDNYVLNLTVPAKMQTYLACGTPIIGAISGQSADIIQEAKCGCVVKQEVKSILEGIDYLYNEDTTQLKTNALKYYENNYKKSIVVDNLVSMLEQE